ncbi:MAG: thioesterase family protein [Proteobacteria bacterium]|nr:thioesterase family protein [Pseudomonadota bacterium]
MKRVYGGKVLGEAIKAAQSVKMTVATCIPSIAISCAEAGSQNPVIYEVERSRDGRALAARRVTAIQYGRPIFTLEASFQAREQGYRIPGPGAERAATGRTSRACRSTN